MFTFEDIIPPKSFIGVVIRGFGLRKEGNKKYHKLWWLMGVSLAILSAVTLIEGRFAYGSVTVDVPNVGTVLGMSFLGDTMVWPYIFLVPLCLVLTLKAADRSVSLLNLLCKKVDGYFIGKEYPANYDTTVNEVKKIFKGNVEPTARLNRALPWFLAAVFWFYNTVTCGFNQHEFIPNPYISSDVVLVTEDEYGREEKKTIQIGHDQVLPKWDTSWDKAPGSTLLTRLWTLAFYTALPFIMVKLIWMVWGLTHFIKRCRSWIDDGFSIERMAVSDKVHLVRPFDEDGYGGLAAIAETGMMYFYTAIGFVLLIVMSFFKEGPEPSWHNYVLITLLIPVALVVFLVPIVQARGLMRSVKQNYLSYIGKRLNAMFRQLDQSLRSPEEHKLDGGFHANLSAMKLFHDKVEQIQEWPFSSSILFRVSLVMLAPFSGILINIFVTKIIG